MSGLTRDGTAELVSRDQILRHAREQGNVYFPCSADHEQDWQPYPRLIHTLLYVMTIHTYINTYKHEVDAQEGLDAFRFFFNTTSDGRAPQRTAPLEL